MSSKFNRRPWGKPSLPICIAPPKQRLQDYDGRLPPKLTGYAGWLDLDPLGEQNAQGIITTGPRDGGGLYTGEISFGVVTLGARIQDLYPAPAVDVRITYDDPVWGPLFFDFPTVPMPIGKVFDTHLLTVTTIPATDVMMARFME